MRLVGTRNGRSKLWAVSFFGILLGIGGPACEDQQVGGVTPASEWRSDSYPHDDAHASGDKDQHEQTIQLSEEEMAEFGVEVEQAGPARIETFVELPGEVRPNADRLAHLVPRFEGIATDVRKRVGDSVKHGEVLAVIESSESLAGYELKSLIGGTVIAKHITRGEAVSRETEAFVVADLQTVWVDLSVYQRDLGRLRVGQPVEVSTGGGLLRAHGSISYITPVVDEETRTATARVVLSNPDKSWRPGMFVTGVVLVEVTQAPIAVARAAVQRVGGNTVVFVQDKGVLVPHTIKVGRADRYRIEILEGLVAGDRYVSRGSFLLKSELEKSGFEAGHAH